MKGSKANVYRGDKPEGGWTLEDQPEWVQERIRLARERVRNGGL